MKFNADHHLFTPYLKPRYVPPSEQGSFSPQDFEEMLGTAERLGHELNEIFKEVLVVTLVKTTRPGSYTILVIFPHAKGVGFKAKLHSVSMVYSMRSKPNYSALFFTLRDLILAEGLVTTKQIKETGDGY